MQVSVEDTAENSETVEKELFSSHELQEASPPKVQEMLSSAIASPDVPVLTFSVLSCVPLQDPVQDQPESTNLESHSDELVPKEPPVSSPSEHLPVAEVLEPSSAVLLVEESADPSLMAKCPKELSVSSSDTICPDASPKVDLKLNANPVTGHKKCEYGNGCTVQPSFNYPGEMGGMFCGCHRLEGMINVVNKMCEHEGCHKRPSLNYPGVRPAIRCGEHKLPGMTNSFRKLDTNILSGELKEKAEELKKRPKKRGDMIKVQRHFIKEKIFSAVINEELSREGPLESNLTTSPTSSVQVTQKLDSAMSSNSNPHSSTVAGIALLQSTPNVTNLAFTAPFQSSNIPSSQRSAPCEASTYPGTNQMFSTDFAATYAANLNMFNGDLQRMKDMGFGVTNYLPNGYFPGMQMNQLQFNQFGHFNQFNAGFQPPFQEGRPSLYSNPIPPVAGYAPNMPPPNVSKEGADEVDLSLFASIASTMSSNATLNFTKRRKLEDGTKGKIAELLSRTTEEKSGGAFANVAGRSFRPIVGRATPMTFPKC